MGGFDEFWAVYSNLVLSIGINALLGQELLRPDPAHLPIGVSFFIFHSLSYVVDVYRGQAKAPTCC